MPNFASVLEVDFLSVGAAVGSWPSMKPQISAGSEQPRKDFPLKPRFITNTPASEFFLPARAHLGHSPKLMGKTV